mmetsp:Transcript_26782/g.77366  ORF Transcript_26782/g.77366 Transcript_26782/m.77366 type:complete len:310 (-) Transcript_26782:147-1076(-)
MAQTAKDLSGLASGASPAASFPNAHLVHSGATKGGGTSDPLPRGARPQQAFPNAHLAHQEAAVGNAVAPSAGGALNWSPPEASAHLPLAQLMEAVREEDWAGAFAEGRSKMQAQAAWSASPERCSLLQCLVAMSSARKVLEVGSFCGAAALAMAEAMGKDSEVVALELEPYFVEFGQRFRARSEAGTRIRTIVGPAADSLKDLASKAAAGGATPFDFAVIDGDKASLAEYFELLLKSPGLLSDRAVLCFDMTPFKGQPPARYVKFGQADRWESNSGEQEIGALRALVAALPDAAAHEFGGLLVVRRSAQ